MKSRPCLSVRRERGCGGLRLLRVALLYKSNLLRFCSRDPFEYAHGLQVQLD